MTKNRKEKVILSMKKVKRIVALLGVMVLAGMYIATLVCAFLATPATRDMFMASVVATVMIPILLYVVQLIYKWLNHRTGGK